LGIEFQAPPQALLPAGNPRTKGAGVKSGKAQDCSWFCLEGAVKIKWKKRLTG
jgi:hypothetical protein